MSNRLWILILVLSALNGWARSGTLETAQGAKLRGPIDLVEGAVAITLSNAVPTRVASREIARFEFENGAPLTASGGGTGQGVFGVYFGATNLAGYSAIRLDEGIDFDWHDAEPIGGIDHDNFSAVWMADLEAPTNGAFVFTVAFTGGVRLYLEDRAILDAWRPSPARDLSCRVDLEAGKKYPLRLEYFKSTGPAAVRLLWSGPDIPKTLVPMGRLYPRSFLTNHPAELSSASGWLATFYQSADYTGSSYSRTDPEINFEWRDNAPAPGIRPSPFSVRWSTQLRISRSDTYTFHVIADEGARLWVNDKLLIGPQAEMFYQEVRESILLEGGTSYDLRYETRNTSGPAIARLLWSSSTIQKAILPKEYTNPTRLRPTAVIARTAGPPRSPGVVMRNGSFLAGQVRQANATTVTVAGAFMTNSIPLAAVARILCLPLSVENAQRIQPGQVGVLLVKGDFAEGDFRGIEGGRVRVDSVLFGPQQFDLKKEVAAVVLRDSYPPTAKQEVQLIDGSLLYSDRIEFKPGQLVIRGDWLASIKVATDELALWRRLGPD